MFYSDIHIDDKIFFLLLSFRGSTTTTSDHLTIILDVEVSAFIRILFLQLLPACLPRLYAKIIVYCSNIEIQIKVRIKCNFCKGRTNERQASSIQAMVMISVLISDIIEFCTLRF